MTKEDKTGVLLFKLSYMDKDRKIKKLEKQVQELKKKVELMTSIAARYAAESKHYQHEVSVCRKLYLQNKWREEENIGKID